MSFIDILSIITTIGIVGALFTFSLGLGKLYDERSIRKKVIKNFSKILVASLKEIDDKKT